MINFKQTLLSLLETQKPCYVLREVKIDEQSDNPSYFPSPLSSNLFGTPIWPIQSFKKLERFLSSYNNLFFIAQINLSQVHIPGFPHDGILQFFSLTGNYEIYEEDLPYIEEVQDKSPQHVVIYHKQTDIDNGYYFNNFADNPDYLYLIEVLNKTRLNDVNSIELFFTPHLDTPSAQSFLDGQVDEHITQTLMSNDFNIIDYYNSETILDLAENIDELDKFIAFANTLDSSFSKIDGYPKFISYDPRYSKTKNTQLLLQLNLENFIETNSNVSIYFFINPFEIPILVNGEYEVSTFAQTQIL